MRFIFIAPPGSGKGTQSKHLTERFGISQISTGDILRDHKKRNTELGRQARNYMDKGELVPDKLIIDMIENELSLPKYEQGFILDGFPRTLEQAKALDRILEKMNLELEHVIILDVPINELINRLTARRVCRNCGATYHLIFSPPKREGICDLCGGEIYQRQDDNKETILKRLKIYESQTKPLLEYYSEQGLVKHVNGLGEVLEVFERLKDVLLRATRYA